MGRSKEERLSIQMETLKVFEEDLIEKFILGSGKGGQKVNKTASCVYLKHVPSGIEIKCQQERSRDLNRYLARKNLCEKIEEILYQEKSKKQKLNDKIRRQKKKRSKRAQEKMLQGKRERSQTKELRKNPKETG